MDISDDMDRIGAVPLSRFDLSTRTMNCFRDNRVSTVAELISQSSSNILRWPKAGRKTLLEVRTLLGRLGLKLEGDEIPLGSVDAKLLAKFETDHAKTDTTTLGAGTKNVLHLASAPPDLLRSLLTPVTSITLSTRARNVIQGIGAKFLGDICQLTADDVTEFRNAGRRTVLELSTELQKFGLCLGMKIADWSRDHALKLSKDLQSFIKEDRRNLDKKLLEEIGPEPTNLNEELCRIAMALENGRNVKLLINLWGWSGEGSRTLESVGQELGLTRERVRQIEARALRKLSKHQFETPHLRHSIALLRRAVPDLDGNLANMLHNAGLSPRPFNPRGIKTAAEHLAVTWPFERVISGRTSALASAGEGENLKMAVSVLRRKTSERGCMNILALAADVGISEDRIDGLVRFLEGSARLQWLDDGHQWLYSQETPRNRLFNLCSKVLSVCDRIYLSDLRRAVSKSRRLAMCPPQRVLGAFVQQFGLGKLVDGMVYRNSGATQQLLPESAEAKMISVLDEFGPVMEGEDFAEKCVAAGMNATTHYIYRLVSPVISSLGRGIYCKVGTEVPPGTVEDIIARRRASPRVSDHGWTSKGKLWFGTELSRQILTAGGIRVPSFVSDLVQGEWRVKLPDDTEYGSVMCREGFIWSFRKQLALLGAEPSDLAAFEFDLKSKIVTVRVGGPDLFESLEGSDSVATDDELEGSDA